MTRTTKLRLDRETVRRLGAGVRDAQALSGPRCNTDAYSFCTPCAESVDVCGG
jgi:hypothetical protein